MADSAQVLQEKMAISGRSTAFRVEKRTGDGGETLSSEYSLHFSRRPWCPDMGGGRLQTLAFVSINLTRPIIVSDSHLQTNSTDVRLAHTDVLQCVQASPGVFVGRSHFSSFGLNDARTSGTWVRGLSGPAKHSKKPPLRGGPLRLRPCI